MQAPISKPSTGWTVPGWAVLTFRFKKARTARYFDMETGDLTPMVQPGESLYHLEFSNNGLITFPGGIPLKLDDGTVIGRVGVSGSTVDNDQTVAEACVSACVLDVESMHYPHG